MCLGSSQPPGSVDKGHIHFFHNGGGSVQEVTVTPLTPPPPKKKEVCGPKRRASLELTFEDVPLEKFMDLVFTCMPGASIGDLGLCCACMTSLEH